LEPRGPRWQWWEMDANHWVGYPDKKVAVSDIDDTWLENILTYLARWTEGKTQWRIEQWWCRSIYFSRWASLMWERSDAVQDAICMEIDALDRLTHRKWLERHIIPCLTSLEAEARRRGLEVPAIPSYKCRRTLWEEDQEVKRQEAEKRRQAREAKRKTDRERYLAAGKTGSEVKEKKKRRPYRCSLCRQPGHTRPNCPQQGKVPRPRREYG